jgi:serine/threonine protein kinase
MFRGVLDILAPAVVGGTGHDDSVDWWALAVVVYHLITGESLVSH